MNAVLVALLLGFGVAWIFRFLGFAVLWMIGVIVFAAIGLPTDLSLTRAVLAVAAVAIAGQVGYFVGVFVQVLREPEAAANEEGRQGPVRQSRFLRQRRQHAAPHDRP